ncbi:hypothetical protein L6164_002587 [Bauhinia variegata]|uniref:Uncharacterized protein n=1 Tax=Bauhinia variegata TaxID=167791 RepID=A0ACB9PZ87_BAUVA|nr:hypothetical protein L6164_002587 [Bauhinia variegata]
MATEDHHNEEHMTLRKFVALRVHNALSSIKRPVVEANNFEIKHVVIQMYNGIYDEAIKLRLFSFSLRDGARRWLNSLPPGSVESWELLARKFSNKYFPPSKIAKLWTKIVNFTQFDRESLYDAWERFEELFKKCPHHGMQDWLVMQWYMEQVLRMHASWVEDPDGDNFKNHLAKIPGYLWVGEDGMTRQALSSQSWDASFSLRALLASNLNGELGPAITKAHYFLKKCQVKENSSGDFKRMFHHINKGSWTLSDQDHALQVSDSTAENLKCCLLLSMMPREMVGEKLEVEWIYEAVNFILSLQVRALL